MGAETGLLDQLARFCAPPDAALRIDFRTLDIEPVPLDLGDWTLVTLESGAEHDHADGGYNERRAECRAACDALGVEDLSRPSRGRRRAPGAARPPRAPRADGERARRRDGRRAARRRAEEAARLLDASHASLRDDYEASVPAVEAAVAALKARGRGGRADGRRRLRRLGAGAPPARRRARRRPRRAVRGCVAAAASTPRRG